MIQNFLTQILKLCILYCLVQAIVTNIIYQFVDVSSKTINQAYIPKLEYFKKKINDYNTVFVGSSRSLNGIDINEFNQKTGLKAFNFGVPTFFIPKSIITLEDLYPIIKDSKIKLIFFEISDITTIYDKYKGEEFYYNTKFLYDFETCLLRKPFHKECWEQSTNGALRKFFTSTKLLFKKKIINKWWVDQISLNSGYQILFDNPNNPNQARIEFLKANSKIDINEDPVKYTIKTNQHSFYKHLQKILKKYQDLGIQIILYNTPITPLNSIHAYFDDFIKVNNYTFIEVSSKKYPSLFDGKLFFDGSHLNKNGAILFADILSESYLNLKKEGRNNAI